MSKYPIMLTEAEAKALRQIIDNVELTKSLPRQTILALLRIGDKIQRQAEWGTW